MKRKKTPITSSILYLTKKKHCLEKKFRSILHMEIRKNTFLKIILHAVSNLFFLVIPIMQKIYILQCFKN